MTVFRKLMVANRGEIAIRVFRSAHELGIRTVAVYSHEDRFALHRLKADEAYQVGKAGEPIHSYLNIPTIVGLAQEKQVDAIHPGYGFLSENAEFAQRCARAGIVFVGPPPELLDLLGDKVAARNLAREAGVPILAGSDSPVLPGPGAQEVAGALGYPVIVKAALAIGRRVGYENAATVEFLVDDESGTFYFIEVNPRLQVEHTITEIVTGIDIVKSQILIAQGCELADPDIGIAGQESIQAQGHAIQCRITSEDPTNNFTPDYGRVTHYRSSGGPGLRLDGGSTTTGAIITPFYDSLLVKISAYARRFKDAALRMKMETTLYAERPGRVAAVIAMVGLQVKAGDLLLKMTSE